MCGVSLSVLWALHMTYKEIIMGKVRGVLSWRWCPHPLLFHVWQAWICKYLENFPSICQLVFSYPSSRHLYFLIFTFPRWEIDGETVETVSDFIFWGSKITPDGDCSHEIKRHLLLGRKVMTNLEHIQKHEVGQVASRIHSPAQQGQHFREETSLPCYDAPSTNCGPTGSEEAVEHPTHRAGWGWRVPFPEAWSSKALDRGVPGSVAERRKRLSTLQDLRCPLDQNGGAQLWTRLVNIY